MKRTNGNSNNGSSNRRAKRMRVGTSSKVNNSLPSCYKLPSDITGRKSMRENSDFDLTGSLLGDESNPIMKIIESLTGGGAKISQEENHIVFNEDVTMSHIRSLIETINEANRDYERAVIDHPTSFVFPKPIYLHITSTGGDLCAGFLAYDAIKNSKIPIYTVVNGYAISSGSIMFMAGHKRFMYPNSYMLIHQINMTTVGHVTKTNNEMMDDAANNLEMMRRLYDIYLNEFRHGYSPVPADSILTRDILEEHMSHDIFWNFQTCYKFGLTDGLFTNYQEREEIDRKDFADKLANSEVTLPTYEETAYAFGRNNNVVFGERPEELKPSEMVAERLSVLAKKNAETREQNEAGLQDSALGRILNQLGEGSDQGPGRESIMRSVIDLDSSSDHNDSNDSDYDNEDDSVRVISTQDNIDDDLAIRTRSGNVFPRHN